MAALAAEFSFQLSGFNSDYKWSSHGLLGRAGQPRASFRAFCSCDSVVRVSSKRELRWKRKEVNLFGGGAFSARKGRGGWARACAELEDEDVAQDAGFQERALKDTREREQLRQKEKEEELLNVERYKSLGQQILDYPKEDVRHAKLFVSDLIKAGSAVEQLIVDAAENDELTPLILLVIKNRLDLARHDDERHAVQALDLLYRRIESEMLRKEASLSMLLLDELLNSHDGFSREEWLLRCRNAMLKMFAPEDAFTVLGSPDFDLSNHYGPIEMPEEDEDVLLRIDFIREVDALLQDLEATAGMQSVTGLDPASIALRLRQEEKKRAIDQVKDIRHLAATLKW